MKKTEYCRTTFALAEARKLLDKKDVRLSIVLVCDRCNVVPPESHKKVVICGGDILCWECFEDYAKAKLNLPEAGEKEKLLTIVEPYQNVTNLFRLRNFHSSCNGD